MNEALAAIGLNQKDVLICVAPNGARKTREDHPAVPILPHELAEEAKACMEAGASMIHLHVRDEDGKHTILPEYYRPALKAVREAVGDDMVIQITTEAVGQYSASEQMAAVRALKPEAVSLALKELVPFGEESDAREFFSWVHEQGILAQYILYSVEDIERFKKLHNAGVIPDKIPNILFVLGRYSKTLTSEPEELLPMLEALGDFKAIWAVCAFGPKEGDCMALAVEKGGNCRIGFENNMFMPNGEKAANNAILIEKFVDRISNDDFRPVGGKKAREIYISAGQ